jgi:hypothetical protein
MYNTLPESGTPGHLHTTSSHPDITGSPDIANSPNIYVGSNSHTKGDHSDTEDSDFEPSEVQITQFKECYKREGLTLDLTKYNIVCNVLFFSGLVYCVVSNIKKVNSHTDIGIANIGNIPKVCNGWVLHSFSIISRD